MICPPWKSASRQSVEIDTKADYGVGPNRGSRVSRMLILAALIAGIYFLGTSLFSNRRSAALVQGTFNALHYGSSRDQITVFNNRLRWSAHYAEFFVLFVLLTVWPLRIRPLSAVILCVLLGAADEGHQYFIPGRSCSPFDLKLDSAGAVTAFILVLAARHWRGSRTAAATVSG
jgi:VanZ family protein